MMASFLAAALAISTTVSATTSPVAWQSDYGKALRATRSDDRPLLVVLELSAATPPEMSPIALTNDPDTDEQPTVNDIKDELLRPYQLCRVDVSTDYGRKVAKAFGVTEFPHTAIIDRTGSVIIFAKTGELTASEWESTLASHKEGERPTTSLVSNFESMSGDTKPFCASCQRNF